MAVEELVELEELEEEEELEVAGEGVPAGLGWYFCCCARRSWPCDSQHGKYDDMRLP